jgi:GntR family transcriptional regulator, rspAB operon transcriptional repressor
MRAGDRVYDALREEIVSWRLPPGAELSEVEQAARWGVSRTPLREALGRLTAEGLAVVGRGRTLVVSGVDAGEVRHLFELREALETQVARLAALRRDPAVFERLADRLAASRSAADDPDRSGYYGLVAELDAALDDAARSPHLGRALATLRPQVARVRRLAHDDDVRLAAAATEHHRIARAVADGDPVLAPHATAVHLHAALAHVLDALGSGTAGSAPTERAVPPSTPTPTGAAS